MTVTAQLCEQSLLEQRILDKMCDHARQLGINRGVAAVCMARQNSKEFIICYKSNGSVIREPDPRIPDDNGVNYFALAGSEIAEMVSLLRDSGDPDHLPRKGESGCKGGLIKQLCDGTLLFVAFAGAEDGHLDMRIAYEGLGVR